MTRETETIAAPYLLFLGDAPDDLAAKTAFGIAEWRREKCVGQLRMPGCKTDLGLPELAVGEAALRGARTLVIGVVNAGGTLSPHWVPVLCAALEAGLDIASGLHTRLASFPDIRKTAERYGRRLFDVRHSDRIFSTGTGERRPGKRLITVGTDCAVGKKYTALAIEAALKAEGRKATFRATGQTGILISGGGVAIDAVVSDFVAGAAEWLSPANAPDHWDIIEGQGSLFHPSYAGVTLGLLHGSQPDAFVVCHEVSRQTMRGVSHPLPSIHDVIGITVRLGQLTNPGIACVGLSINTASLPKAEALALLKTFEREHGVPAIDPLRTGADTIVARLA